MPTILLKKSDTPGSVPGTANLTNLAGGVEVAVNTADKRVYSMTSASAVIELGTNPSSLTCSDVSATVLRAGSATITNLLGTTLTISGNSFLATSSGNVGIGTASPGEKLAVNGSIGLQRSGTQYWHYGVNASNALVFTRSAVADRLTLDSDGNLGLGVTPSAWSGRTAIQLPDSAYVVSSGPSVLLGANVYFNGVNRTYISNGVATDYRQINGEHRWEYAASGTINTAISFTQAMTLDASGNLVVGNTTANERLEIYKGISYNADPALYFRIGANDGAVNNNAPYTWRTGITGSASGYSYVFQTLARTESSWVERGRFTAGGYFKASNDGTYVGSTSNYHEFRSSNNTYAAYITNTNASPLGTVIEYNNASPNGTGNVFLFCGDSTATRATIRSNGGLANYQTNDVNLSDERVKTDIAPLGSMWAKIKALEIVTFKYKDQTHDDDNIGLIAQQVESVAPEFVDADGWGETPEDGVPLKSIYTADMYHAAIKALQEAMARIESLEADMAALKGAK